LSPRLQWGLAYSLYLFLHSAANSKKTLSLSNPFDLGMALKFGVAFTVIFLAARAAQIYLGDTGIYISSILSGLVGVDAIVLSLAELSRGGGGVDPATASRGIVLAAAANTFAKGAS
jgi:uncharacterized membrane protein (DUF4010 family)